MIILKGYLYAVAILALENLVKVLGIYITLLLRLNERRRENCKGNEYTGEGREWHSCEFSEETPLKPFSFLMFENASSVLQK